MYLYEVFCIFIYLIFKKDENIKFLINIFKLVSLRFGLERKRLNKKKLVINGDILNYMLYLRKREKKDKMLIF